MAESGFLVVEFRGGPADGLITAVDAVEPKPEFRLCTQCGTLDRKGRSIFHRYVLLRGNYVHMGCASHG